MVILNPTQFVYLIHMCVYTCILSVYSLRRIVILVLALIRYHRRCLSWRTEIISRMVSLHKMCSIHPDLTRESFALH